MPNQNQTSHHLTRRQKAALLLLTLDMDASSALIQSLSQREIEQLVVEISNLKGVSSATIDEVMKEFVAATAGQDILVQGGPDEAKKLIERSLGTPRASEVFDRVNKLAVGNGFDRLKQADSRQLGKYLQEEHPQTIALLLSNLGAEKVVEILNEFGQDMRNDVTMRMATLGTVSPALLAEMEKVVESIAGGEISQDLHPVGGAKSVAGVLNRCDAETSKGILSHIEQKDPNLATEIKRLMFVFEDIVKIDDRGVQRILREVDKKDLAMALKIADEAVKDKVYGNMSERARDLLKEELQYMGPVRLKEVEAAQNRIIDVIKQLQEQGEIVVAGRGGKEDVLV